MREVVPMYRLWIAFRRVSKYVCEAERERKGERRRGAVAKMSTFTEILLGCLNLVQVQSVRRHERM